MDALANLPDFQALVAAGDVTMYRAFGGDNYYVVPRQLVVAGASAEKARFRLIIVKSLGMAQAGNYAALALDLAGDFPLEEALIRARTETPGATVAPAPINGGFARLYSTGKTIVLPADMAQPVPLGWAGPDFIHWTTRLSVDAGELIKGALSTDALLIASRVEFDVLGVAVRLPVTVAFEPAKVIQALVSLSSGRQVAVTELPGLLTHLDQSAFKMSATANPEALAPALADRLIAQYTRLVPSPSPADPPFVEFKSPDQIDAGTINVDLSQPVITTRQFALTLDPLANLRAEASVSGGGDLVKEIVVPPLDLGFQAIELTANLPSTRIGVPAIGINLEVPPDPPNRPSAVHQTVVFTPPDDSGTVKFQLSPEERLSYTITPFALVAALRARTNTVRRRASSPARGCNSSPVTFPSPSFTSRPPTGCLSLRPSQALLAIRPMAGSTASPSRSPQATRIWRSPCPAAPAAGR
jgi:hypothetical protein